MKRTKVPSPRNFLLFLFERDCLEDFILHYHEADHSFTLKEFFFQISPADWISSAFLFARASKPAYFWLEIDRQWHKYCWHLF